MSIQTLKDKIKSSDSILIVPSAKYDFDSVGTALSVRWYLDKLGKKSDIVFFGDLPNSVKMIDDVETTLRSNSNTFDFNAYSLMILVDGNNFRQFLGNNYAQILNQFQKENIINIDHHLKGDIENLVPDNSLRMELAPSTGKVFYDAFIKDKFDLDNKVANYLMYSLIGDTGGFSYGVRDDIFEFADKLLKAGADYQRINDFRVTKPTMDFTLFLTSKVEFYPEISTTILSIDKSLRDEIVSIFGKTWESDDLMHYFNSFFINRIEGFNHSFVLKDFDNLTKISYRGTYKSQIDIMDLFKAVEINGGGHKNAAGGASSIALPELKAKIIEYITGEVNRA